ncbi:MAG: tetratricopeptide repeat protein [Phycisphaerae bacterium]
MTASRGRAAAGLVRTCAWTLLVLMLAAAVAPAAEPVTLPKDLADRLRAAQDDLRAGRPAAAVQRLRTLPEGVEDHALRHLVLGHAHLRQSALEPAAAAYRRALAMDPAMTEAGLGLAQVRVRQERWRDAADLLGRHLDADACPADLLFLYAQTARALEDGRLGRLLVEKGIARFPSDARFRRMDLALAVDEDDAKAAARAAEHLLAASPGDAGLWRHLAWARGRMDDPAGRIAALEAAVLCDGSDLATRRALLAAELAAGNWPTVLARGRDLLAGPLAETAAADVDLMDVLIRAADAGEADATLRAWLGRVPPPKRTRAMRVAEARLALRQGERGRAREILKQLIEMGDAGPSVFLWAGHLAEQAEDWTEAVTYYDHARRFEGRDGRLATLYLARLHLRRGRDAEAVRLLRSHLAERPEDAVARSLLALAEEDTTTETD